jgi:hypothetical protein
MHKTILLFISILCIQFSFGQQLSKEEKLERIRIQKIAFITSKLNLSSDEAQVFWPVYNDFLNKKKLLNTEKRKANRKLHTYEDEYSAEKKIELIDKVVAHHLKDAHLRQEFHKKFKSILPVDKLILLYDAESQFKNYLLKQIKGHQKKAEEAKK